VAKPPCALFLLDWRPVPWSTREEYFRQLSLRLAARGITPVLTVSEEPAREVREIFEQAGAEVVARSYHQSPYSYWRHIRRMARGRSVRFAHVRFFDYFAGVLWMCRLSGIRTILFTEANSGEWKGRGWRAALVRLRTAFMCRPLTRAIAISAFIRGRLISVGIPQDRIAVVYNGVDTARFHADPEARAQTRREMGAKDQTIVVIFAAVLLEWKRPETALAVCAELVKRGVDVQLWIAGDGPLRQRLETRTGGLGIAHQVRWLGHRSDPQRWFAGADLFLHTALGEAFGNVLIEAMACGLPVIASKSGAVPELVADGVSGRLINVNGRETVSFAEVIQDIMSDSQRYQAISAAAAHRAQAFSTARCVDETCAVYEPFLGPHNAEQLTPAEEDR
jgi:glycosyltransferase involved in cell wall biosynthesis